MNEIGLALCLYVLFPEKRTVATINREHDKVFAFVGVKEKMVAPDARRGVSAR